MPHPRSASRYRRRVLGVGGLVAVLLFAVGAPIYVQRIERDLERAVPVALGEAGFSGITAEFSGQEGTLTCAAPLTDPEGALTVAHDVRGVDSMTLDRGCRVNTGSEDPDGDAAAPTGSQATSGTGSTSTSVPGFATVGAALAGDPQFEAVALLADGSELAARLADASAEPVTVFAPTNAAFDGVPAGLAGQLDSDAELRSTVLSGHIVAGALEPDSLAELAGTTVATLAGTELAVALDGDTITVGGVAVGGRPINTPNGVVYAISEVLLPADLADATRSSVVATLTDAGLTVSGAVADEAARDVLVLAATAAAGDRFDNQLTVDSAATLDADGAADLATLITALAAELVSGSAGFDGEALSLRGVYANDAGATRAEAAAAAVGAGIEIERRPDATPEQAAALETELNEFVRANPITFAPGSAVLDESAGAVIDQLAARLVTLGGLSVVVEGHTDSDGQAATNRALSEQRAGAVVQALVAGGVDPATITAQGFGSDEPVLTPSGVEDKTASRRVEFQISAG